MSEPIRKTISLPGDAVKKAEAKYAPEFGEFNWSAYVVTLVQENLCKAKSPKRKKLEVKP